jgi:hypothetical protein
VGIPSLLSVHGAAGADHGIGAEDADAEPVVIGATGSAGIAGGVQAGVVGMGAVTWAGVDVGAVHAGVAGLGGEAAGTGGVAIGAIGRFALRTTLVEWLVA